MNRKIQEYLQTERWLQGDQLYFTLPDAAVLAARRQHVEPAAWQYSGCKVYIVDWAKQFPDVLKHHCGGRPYPPCPRCYDKAAAEPDVAKRLELAASKVNSSSWAKQPRRFVDVDTFHFVYSKNYRCRQCNGEFKNLVKWVSPP